MGVVLYSSVLLYIMKCPLIFVNNFYTTGKWSKITLNNDLTSFWYKTIKVGHTDFYQLVQFNTNNIVVNRIKKLEMMIV